MAIEVTENAVAVSDPTISKSEYETLTAEERRRGRPCEFCTKIPNGGASWRHAVGCPRGAASREIHMLRRELNAEAQVELARSAAATRAAEAARQAACPDCRTARETGTHPNQRWISHEEVQCRRCGTFYCIPDID